MISENDTRRIRDDAYIAHDALESLMFAPNLSEAYIAEKIRTVENCVRFIKTFCGGINENN